MKSPTDSDPASRSDETLQLLDEQDNEDSIPLLSVETLSSSFYELTGQPVVYAKVKNNHSRSQLSSFVFFPSFFLSTLSDQWPT